MPARAREHIAQHVLGEFAGGGILLAGMIRAYEQRIAVSSPVLPIVAKRERGAAADDAAVLQDRQVDVECDLAESDHDSNVLKDVELAFEIATAIPNLVRRGLIRRGRTPHRRRDIGPGQHQSVVPADAVRLGGEASLVERAVQPVAGAVSGEYPARPVAAMRRRRQPDDEPARVRIAEPRHRPAPIVPIQKRAAFYARYFAAVRAQTRTKLARNHFLLENAQPVFNAHEPISF